MKILGNVDFQVEKKSENATAAAELCYAIIEQAGRDAMWAKGHNSANCGSPTEAAKRQAITYFKSRGYAGHAGIAGISERTMERVRTAVLETAQQKEEV